jgi:hypothetical protein
VLVDYNPELQHIGDTIMGVTSTAPECLPPGNFIVLATLTFDWIYEPADSFTLGAAAMSSAVDCEGADQWLGGAGVQVFPVEGVAVVPSTEIMTLNCAPNPFNPRLEVSFEMPEPGHLAVTVYSSAGEVVAELYNGFTSEGSVFWNGRNSKDQPAASGTYIVESRSNNSAVRKKVMLFR